MKQLTPERFIKIIEHITGEKIENISIASSQIGRTDGKKVDWYPSGIQQFDALKTCPDEVLKEVGMQKYNDTLWLFPGEWYNHIPEGYKVINIFNEEIEFDQVKIGSGTRYGALSCGFIKEEVLEIYSNILN